MTLPQRYRIVQVPTVMVYCAPAGKPPDNLGLGLLASLHVHLQPGGLKTTDNNRVGVVPETDGTGRFSLPNDPGYRFLHRHVHERIIRILNIDQSPGFQDLYRLLRWEYCFHKIITRNT